jgi:hypothetical protein
MEAIINSENLEDSENSELLVLSISFDTIFVVPMSILLQTTRKLRRYGAKRAGRVYRALAVGRNRVLCERAYSSKCAP